MGQWIKRAGKMRACEHWGMPEVEVQRWVGSGERAHG